MYLHSEVVVQVGVHGEREGAEVNKVWSAGVGGDESVMFRERVELIGTCEMDWDKEDD